MRLWMWDCVKRPKPTHNAIFCHQKLWDLETKVCNIKIFQGSHLFKKRTHISPRLNYQKCCQKNQSDCAASHHHHLSFLLCNAQVLLRRLIYVWHLIIGPSHLVCLKLIKRMKISQPRTEQTASPTLEGNHNLIGIGFSFAADDKSQQFNWYQCVSEHLDYNWIALLNIAGWKNINFRPI